MALRFFSSPHDAEDVTQEILLKVVTHLSAYDGRAKVTTWVHTIASRHLLESRRRAGGDSVQGPRAFAEWLDRDLGTEPDVAEETEFAQLCGEVRLACTYGMLLCLSTLRRAAEQLDLAEALAEVYRADPEFLAPDAVLQRLRQACPDLLGTG